ncbi:MAG: hypothetical protein V1678_03045 [Candidatus Aenigmatarchaeota archaeon]
MYDKKGMLIPMMGTIFIIITIVFFAIVGIFSSSQEAGVIQSGGKAISLSNYAEFWKKSFDESVQIISKRTAFSLGKSGGFIESNGLPEWNSTFPDLDYLLSQYEEGINENLPTGSITSGNNVEWKEGTINVSYTQCGQIQSSNCFYVNGTKNFVVSDRAVDSKIIFNPYIFYTKIDSNYLRLLSAGRALFEESKFNTELNNLPQLRDDFIDDARFAGLDLQTVIDGRYVNFTISDKTCLLNSEGYCIAPVKPGENKAIDPLSMKPIPFNYLELKFKVNISGAIIPPAPRQVTYTFKVSRGSGKICVTSVAAPVQCTTGQTSMPITMTSGTSIKLDATPVSLFQYFIGTWNGVTTPPDIRNSPPAFLATHDNSLIEAYFCQPATCASLFKDCGGPWQDGCNGVLNCGSCSGTCNNGVCEYCTDGRCNNGETCSSCSDDCGACPPVCGDTICNGAETCSSCPGDCGTCPPTCGDSSCNGVETCSTCPSDCGACPAACGDGSCNGAETCSTCPSDCGACCGDGNCDSSIGETCSSCPGDCGTCPPTCGDSFCRISDGETCSTCPADCGNCITCPDGTCNGGIGEDCSTCPSDCGACPACPDGNCDGDIGEDCSTCPSDCGACPACPDGNCDGGETCSSCPEDCGSCVTCPDGICDGTIGETCSTCPSDCGSCCTSGSTQGCTYCFGTSRCTGTQTCAFGNWGSCGGGSCSCVVNQCGATSCGGGCTINSQCTGGNACTSKRCNTVTGECEYPALAYGTVPDNHDCGTKTASCSGYCSSDYRYTVTNAETCYNFCDGTGRAPTTGCASCSPTCRYSAQHCNYGCNNLGTDCKFGKRCQPATATCRNGATGACGDEKSIFTGSCYPPNNIPSVLNEDATCYFGWPIIIWRGNAKVVSNCAACSFTDRESFCAGSGCGLTGCVLASCPEDSTCPYHS